MLGIIRQDLFWIVIIKELINFRQMWFNTIPLCLICKE